MLIPFGVFSAGVSVTQPSDYELISTTVLSTTPTSVTLDLTGLSATYKHLQVRASYQMSNDFNFRLNNDSGSNYSYHYLYGNGSGVTSGGNGGQNRGYIGYRGSENTNQFGSTIIDFYDIFSTNKFKTVKALSGQAETSSNFIFLTSSSWQSTSATTSIYLFGNSGNAFTVGTRISLYGLKG